MGGLQESGSILLAQVDDEPLREEAWMAKLDSKGTETWEKSFQDRVGIFSIQPNTDGSCIALGATGSHYLYRQKPWIVKLAGDGKVVWNQTYGSTPGDDFASVTALSEEQWMIVGTSSSGGEKDAWLARIDAAGKQQWSQSYGGQGIDEGLGVFQEADGDLIVAGITWSYGGVGRALVFRVDQGGTQKWAKVYDEIDRPTSIISSNDGGILILGEAQNADFATDGVLMKIDYRGTILWKKTLTELNAPTIIRATGDAILICGTVATSPARSDPKWRMVTMLLTGKGDEVWRRAYAGFYVKCAKPTSDGGWIVGGWSTVFSMSHLADAYVIKFSQEGNLEWTKNLGGEEWEEIHSIAQSNDGGYLVGGIRRIMNKKP